MTDEERAEEYEQLKDDDQDWQELDEAFHVPDRVKRKGLTTSVTIRFDPEDAAKLRLLAERLSRSYSDVIREAVREVIAPRFVVDHTQQNFIYDMSSFGVRYSDSSVRRPMTAETMTGSTTIWANPFEAVS